MSLLLAPVLAAITALTVSTKLDVPIDRIYVPVAVIGGTGFALHGGTPLALKQQDVTTEEVDAVKARLIAAGIAADRIATWMQQDRVIPRRDDPRTSLQIAVVVVDVGSPTEARTTIPLLTKLGRPPLLFGWNQFVSVDCQAMNERIRAQLDVAAHAAAAQFAAANGTHVTIRSVTLTATDPRTGPFDPLPLCPATAHPTINDAAQRPPGAVSETLTRYVSASVELAYDAAVPKIDAPASTTSIFPFSTFGFATPIIGHQNQAYVLQGGRFAATPGASDVAVPADSALITYTFRTRDKYESATTAIAATGLAAQDYQHDDDALQLYVRLRPGTMQLWPKIASLSDGNTTIHRFVNDCGSLRTYAHAIALERSHRLAEAAASALQVAVGPLVVETDWAGAGSNAVCGDDGEGDLTAVIASAKREQGWSSSDPQVAYFWDNIYAAWTLGTSKPTIVSHKIVERLVPVIQSTQVGTNINGTATITPDAYFFTDRTTQAFTTTLVASKTDVPKDMEPGNVVTDCDAAQAQSLANAVKVALFNGPVQSLYANPASFLSIACLDKGLIGHTYSSLPTVYNASSPTGAAQVTTSITVYP